MSPPALVTLLSPLASGKSTAQSAAAAGVIQAPAAAGGAAPNGPIGLAAVGLSCDASNQSLLAPFSDLGINCGVTANVKPSGTGSGPGKAKAGGEKAADTNTATPPLSTPVAGLMKAAGAENRTMDLTSDCVAVSAAAHVELPVSLQPEVAQPPQASRRSPQRAARPRTAAEAAAAHAASKRSQRSHRPSHSGGLSPAMSDAEITETISRICRPAAPELVSPTDTHPWLRRDPLDPLCSLMLSATGAALGGSGTVAATVGNGCMGYPGLYQGDSGDPLPDCGDITTLLAMSDDEERHDALQQAAEAFAAIAPPRPPSLAPPPPPQAAHAAESALSPLPIRAPSPSPAMASSYCDTDLTDAWFGFLPMGDATKGNAAGQQGQSLPVSIPTPSAFLSGAAANPHFSPAPAVKASSVREGAGMQTMPAQMRSIMQATQTVRSRSCCTSTPQSAQPSPPRGASAHAAGTLASIRPTSVSSGGGANGDMQGTQKPWSSRSQPLVSVMGFHQSSSASNTDTNAYSGSVSAQAGVHGVVCQHGPVGKREPIARGALSGSMSSSQATVETAVPLPDMQSGGILDLPAIKTAASSVPRVDSGGLGGSGSSGGASDGSHSCAAAGDGPSAEDAVIPPSAVRRSQACRSGVASPFGTSPSPPLAGGGIAAAARALAHKPPPVPTPPHAAKLPPRQSTPPDLPVARVAVASTPSRLKALFDGSNNPLDSIRTEFAAGAESLTGAGIGGGVFSFGTLTNNTGNGTAAGARTACMPSPCGSPPRAPGGVAGSWGAGWRLSGAVAGGMAVGHARRASDSWTPAPQTTNLALPDCL